MRELGIDLTGKLDPLVEPITKSFAIYEAARNRLRGRDGYAELQDIRPSTVNSLCQASDDFEIVYRQAALAQMVLMDKIASRWQPDPANPNTRCERLETRAVGQSVQ